MNRPWGMKLNEIGETKRQYRMISLKYGIFKKVNKKYMDTHNEIFSHKKEGNFNTCNNTDGYQGHSAKRKSDRKRHYNLAYMYNLKKTKQKQTQSPGCNILHGDCS